MEYQRQEINHAPCIKCSGCDADVPMNELQQHTCASVMPMVEEPEQIQYSANESTQTNAIPVARPSRPLLPRLDSVAATRTGPHGELTPASSHGSIGHSPVSPGAGKRSPFLHPPRKASVAVMRRPPSPELLSQDCAFPPFPSNKNKNKPSSQKTNVRGRTLTPEANNSSRSFEHEARRSASVGASRSRLRQGTGESSRPSTAQSSRRPSLSSRAGSRAGSRQGSIDEVPPLPALQPSISHTTTSSEQESKSSDSANTWPLPSEPTPAPDNSSSEVSPFPELVAQESYRSSPDPVIESPSNIESPIVRNPVETTLVEAPREPSYRSKRPPPIENLPIPTVDNMTVPKPEPSPREAPPPTPTSTLARTLTSLFGRKRNQSTSSKKNAKTPATDGPRFIALSPDPDPQDIPRFDDSSHSSMHSEMLPSPPVHGIQEVPQSSADITAVESTVYEPSQAQILEPEELEEPSRDSVHMEHEFEKTLASVVAAPRLSTVPEHSEDTRRASIDSASSYGSEGFSHSRASSRSTNAVNVRSYGSSISTAHTTASSDELTGPAFAKFREIDAVPDSPTDPYLQQGRLAPVLEKPASLSPPEEAGISVPVIVPVPPIPESETEALESPLSKRQRRPSTPGTNRGFCRGCSQMIVQGQKSVSSKDGRLTGRYHKECFVCKTCREPFATADFYVHEDYPYCAHDYHVINETLCESCGKGIEGHYLETSNLTGNGTKKFHPHCLKCATCKIGLNDDYFEMGGKVYCEKDAFRMATGPRSPYGTAPSRPSPLNREYISSGEPGSVLAAGKFPERRLTRLMTTY